MGLQRKSVTAWWYGTSASGSVSGATLDTAKVVLVVVLAMDRLLAENRRPTVILSLLHPERHGWAQDGGGVRLEGVLPEPNLRLVLAGRQRMNRDSVPGKLERDGLAGLQDQEIV